MTAAAAAESVAQRQREMLRIVHVVQWLRLGGGESVAMQLATRQRAEGHRVSVLALSGEGSLRSELEQAGVEVHAFDKRPCLDGRLPARVAQWLWQQRAQVVHVHDPQSLIYAAWPARVCGARVIYTKHGETIGSARQLWLQRAAAAAVHVFTAVSESTAATARARREVAERKLKVVANGVDLDRYRPQPEAGLELRETLGLGATVCLIGIVGRLEAEKNHALLLRAVAPLLGEATRLIVVGEGSLGPQLEQQAQQLGVAPSVHWLGRRRDVARLLAALDVFVLSSSSEGMPLAVMEAMASGLPIVATRVGGMEALLDDGVEGLLVPSAGEHELRVALAALLDDLPRAQAMGQAARGRAERQFGLAATAAHYMALYRGA